MDAMAKTKKIVMVERALDERVSDIMGMPDIMRVASAPGAIWVGTILSWLPDELLIQRSGPDSWSVSCDGLEASGWSFSVALCRMVVLLHEREMNDDQDAE